MTQNSVASAFSGPIASDGVMTTSSRHIAMVASPAISHVLPSLELIKELVARGHRVTYATKKVVSSSKS